jgi:hypothetical protein
VLNNIASKLLDRISESLFELFYNVREFGGAVLLYFRENLFELQVKLSDLDLVNFTAICEAGYVKTSS